jgi:hypothetical protein
MTSGSSPVPALAGAWTTAPRTEDAAEPVLKRSGSSLWGWAQRVHTEPVRWYSLRFVDAGTEREFREHFAEHHFRLHRIGCSLFLFAHLAYALTGLLVVDLSLELYLVLTGIRLVFGVVPLVAGIILATAKRFRPFIIRRYNELFWLTVLPNVLTVLLLRFMIRESSTSLISLILLLGYAALPSPSFLFRVGTVAVHVVVACVFNAFLATDALSYFLQTLAPLFVCAFQAVVVGLFADRTARQHFLVARKFHGMGCVTSREVLAEMWSTAMFRTTPNRPWWRAELAWRRQKDQQMQRLSLVGRSRPLPPDLDMFCSHLH